jgi:aspartyl-tRNA(Asn)/glutamyl-tRNA(Gln) amidotransferase subunit B
MANWIINDLFSLMNESGRSIDQLVMKPADLVDLNRLVDDGVINSSTAREVLVEVFATGTPPARVVEQKGLAQISDEAALIAIIAQILDENGGQVQAYQGGKDKLLGWFVGQVMRETQGKGNPELVRELLLKGLAQWTP